MLKFVIRRLLIAVVVLLGISVVLFGLLRLVPGDPVDLLFDPMNFQGPEREAAVAQARAQLGLDKPLPVQYFSWLGQTLQGNLGVSFENRRPVLTIMVERLQNTAVLLFFSLVISLVIGFPAGVLAALRRNSWIDYLISATSLAAISLPPFFLGLIGIFVFGLKLGWLPTAGMNSPTGGFLTGLQHTIMPATILGFAGAATFARWARSSMLDVLNQDYLVTARSKGLSKWRIVLRHAVWNALIPMVTVIALTIPVMFGGAVIIEQIFAWPGMGRLALGAIVQRDYPVLMGFVMFTAILVLVSNLVADITYALVDPRIRLDGGAA